MKLESVRLLHAQGVPHHYITNQIYQPVDEDHRKRGTFIILLHQEKTENGSFVASLINTLIREYYRQHATDRLTAFEQTLVRLNEQIKHYLRSTDSESAQLHGCIVLVTDEEIHVSHIGTPLSFLARQNDLLPLVEQGTESSPMFSVITSGEVHENDVLVIVSGLGNVAQVEHDIRFSLTHAPIYESGRAFARLLKQKSERMSEASFIRFNDTTEATYQVYVDRSIETTAEKLDVYKRHLSHHGAFIVSGVQFIGEQIGKTTQKYAERKKSSVLSHNENATTDSSPVSVVTDEKKEAVPIHVITEPSESKPSDFRVTTYWHDIDSHPVAEIQPDKPLTNEAREPEQNHHTAPISPLSLLRFRWLTPRTLYLLLGTLILVGITIRIVNSVVKETPVAGVPTGERDTLVQQAEAAAREADAAQINDDIPTAIEKTILAQSILTKIPEKSQNEKSKALSLRVIKSLAALTKSTDLTPSGTPVSLDVLPRKIVTTLNGTYIIMHNHTIQKHPETSLSLSTNFPRNVEIIDAVPFDNFQKIVVAVKTSEQKVEIYSITTVNDEITPLSRSDDKPWPDTKLIAIFESYLYFIGDKMFKATPNDGKYRVTAYPTSDDTSKITSLINNGFAFYGLENSKQLVRIAANTTKTPIKLYGAPESFLPKSAPRLINTRKEGELFLFDQDKQRILRLSTDGGYKQQYLLPKEEPFTDCDATEKEFLCATTDKQLVTLPYIL